MNKRILLILFFAINVTALMANCCNCRGDVSATDTQGSSISMDDIAEMRALYVADDPQENKAVKLTKWARLNIDEEGELIWISDMDEENGAFFCREDGNLRLITTVWSGLKPAFPDDKDGNHYLMLSGSAGGPTYYTEVFTLRDGKVVETFNAMEIYGEIDQCSLNGNSIGAEQGKAYLEAIPEVKEPDITWHEIIDNE